VLHPRPLHLAWNGLALPPDHLFWTTHYPPNGWGCHCYVVGARSETGARRLGGDPDKRVDPDWSETDPKTGAPVGIDKGWDYAPGAGVDASLRQVVQDKLISYPPAITTALSRDVNRYINANDPPAKFVRRALEDPAVTEPLWLGFVDDFERVRAATGLDVKGYMVLLPADTPRHIADGHEFDGQGQRPAVADDYGRVMEVLSQADTLSAGHETGKDLQGVVAVKRFGAEVYRAVFEVRPGKRNRSLALKTLVIKT